MVRDAWHYVGRASYDSKVFCAQVFQQLKQYRVKSLQLIWWAICYGAGILLYFLLPVELTLWAFILLLVGVCFLSYIFYHRVRIIIILLWLIVTGFSLATISSHLQSWHYESQDLSGNMNITGMVEDTNDGINYSYITLVTSENKRFRVRLQENQAPTPGTIITIWGKLLPSSGYFRRYNFYGNVHGYMIALANYQQETSNEHKINLTEKMKLEVVSLRLRIARKLNSDDSRYASISRALLVGMKRTIPQDVLDSLRHAGLGHILAISGLHFGIFAFGVFFVIRALLATVPAIAEKYHIKQIAAGWCILAGACYLLLSGSPISAERSFIMVALVCLAVMRDARAMSRNLLAVAAVILLTLSPELILTASFQMSFMAVLALITLFDYLQQTRFYRLPKIVKFLAGTMLSTLFASIAVAPFTLLHFGYFANYGLMANVPAIPILAFWVMPWGMLTLLAMIADWHEFPMRMMHLGIEKIVQIAQYISGLEGSVSHPLPASTTILALLIIGLLLLALLWQRRIALYTASGMIAIALCLLVIAPRPTIILTGWNYGFSFPFPNSNQQAQQAEFIELFGKKKYHQAKDGHQLGYIFRDKLPLGNKRKAIMRYLKDVPIIYLRDLSPKKLAILSKYYQCDALLCQIYVRDTHIIIAHQPEAMIPICHRQADIVVSLHHIAYDCQRFTDKTDKVHFINGRDIRDNQGIFLFTDFFIKQYYFFAKTPKPIAEPHPHLLWKKQRIWLE